MLVTDNKREQILDKAVIRFAHFGIQKTTMNEIADDLAMSKPSVYYYFPDKISLFVAVIEKIFGEYSEKLSVRFSNATTLNEAILSLLNLRNEFAQKYFMLHLEGIQGDINFANADIRNAVVKIRDSEIELLTSVFKRAIDNDAITGDNPEHIAELFIDTLSGISFYVLARQEKKLVPDSKGFDEVLSKQRAVAQIFLKGLK